MEKPTEKEASKQTKSQWANGNQAVKCHIPIPLYTAPPPHICAFPHFTFPHFAFQVALRSFAMSREMETGRICPEKRSRVHDGRGGRVAVRCVV